MPKHKKPEKPLQINERRVRDAVRRSGSPQGLEVMVQAMKDLEEENTLLKLRGQERLERPRLSFEIPPYITFPPLTKKAGNCTFTDDAANKILQAIRMGASDAMAAAYAGINPDALLDWKKHLTTEPFKTFQGEYEKAKAYPKFFFLDAIVIHSYSDPEIALKMLKRLEPETFADVLVVKQEGSIQHTHTHNIGSIMDRVVEKVASIRAQSAKQVGASSTATTPAVVNGRPHDPRPPRGAK